MRECRVRFEPFGVEVRVAHGVTILEAARRAGLEIRAQCGGRGTCGLCAVRVVAGKPGGFRGAGAGEEALVLPPGVVLSCLAEVADGLVVRPVDARMRPKSEPS